MATIIFSIIAYFVFGFIKHNNYHVASITGVGYDRSKSFIKLILNLFLWPLLDVVAGIRRITTPRGTLFERTSYLTFLALATGVGYLFVRVNLNSWTSDDGWVMKILLIGVSIVALSILVTILRANLTDDQIHLRHLQD